MPLKLSTHTARQILKSGWVGKRKRGRDHFTSEATERMTEKSPVCLLSPRDTVCPLPKAAWGWCFFIHSPNTVSVCVQTHSRASLFHRKNTCHLYQMAMDFQHKQYFHDTIVIIIYFSARGTPLNKEKDSLISVYSLDQSAVTKWQSLVLMDTETGDRGSQEGPHVQRNCLVKNSLKDNLKRTTEGVYSDFPYCTYAKRPN